MIEALVYVRCSDCLKIFWSRLVLFHFAPLTGKLTVWLQSSHWQLQYKHHDVVSSDTTALFPFTDIHLSAGRMWRRRILSKSSIRQWQASIYMGIIRLIIWKTEQNVSFYNHWMYYRVVRMNKINIIKAGTIKIFLNIFKYKLHAAPAPCTVKLQFSHNPAEL